MVSMDKESAMTLMVSLVAGLLFSSCHGSLLSFSLTAVPVPVRIQTDSIRGTTNKFFVGVTLDMETVVLPNWGHLNVSSQKIKNLASALAPCFFRVGGTTADFVYYNVTYNSREWRGTEDITKNYTMTASVWDRLNEFSREAGWKLIFGLNALNRINNVWFPFNAVDLINYTSHKGYNITGFELGNEPDYFPVNVTPVALVIDFLELYTVLADWPHFKDTMLLGPDIAEMVNPRGFTYFDKFMTFEGRKIVNYATFHHYYFDSKGATQQMFLDTNIMNAIFIPIVRAITFSTKHRPNRKVWIGETSTSYNGGAPGLSDRYIAGFLWLDKLGMSAKLGVDVVIRQSFYGQNYSLLDYYDTNPNPDYWLTLLYKRLVGNKVLNVLFDEQTMTSVRVYGHCTHKNIPQYRKGSITLYAMNLSNKTTELTFPQFADRRLEVYILQPAGTHGIRSRNVALNGVLLQLTKGQDIPDLYIPSIQTGTVSFPSLTFGFIVIPEANLTICS